MTILSYNYEGRYKVRRGEEGYNEVKLVFKAMWNTMECKRDSFNDSLGGASETHWECVSHCLKGGVRVCNFEKIDFFFSYLIVKHFKNIFPKF